MVEYSMPLVLEMVTHWSSIEYEEEELIFVENAYIIHKNIEFNHFAKRYIRKEIESFIKKNKRLLNYIIVLG